MKNRILFLIFLLIPIGLLVWFAFRAQSNEHLAAQQQYQNLAYSQLKLIDEEIINYFQLLENTLIAMKQQIAQKPLAYDNQPLANNTIRKLIKYSPYILNLYIEDREQKIIYPSPEQPISEKEQNFLSEIQVLTKNRSLFSIDKEAKQKEVAKSEASGLTAISKKLTSFKRSSQYQEASITQEHGWITWYKDRNLHHVFWFKDLQGKLYLLYLDRIRILSELIALLPERALSSGSYEQTLKDTSIRLSDSNDEIIYEWGSYLITESVNDDKSINIMLSYPLSSWKLSWYSKALSENRFQQTWSLLLIALLASFLLLVLMFIFYREYNREIKLARQRVNFVGQVSHELKTPLTNIRMYAELLETKLFQQEAQQQEQSKSQHFVSVIINESQRLSRLIENVLSFSKVQKQTFKINRSIAIIDDCIDTILLSFKPIFAQKGLVVNFERNAAKPVCFDPQILEQILNNLFSNIEKYAAEGKKIDIVSEHSHNKVMIEVRDYGPGIAASEQAKIFKPFYRSHAKITEGVSGTGIGLTISQQLAILHGGSLNYKPVSEGACFVLQLEVTNQENL